PGAESSRSREGSAKDSYYRQDGKLQIGTRPLEPGSYYRRGAWKRWRQSRQNGAELSRRDNTANPQSELHGFRHFVQHFWNRFYGLLRRAEEKEQDQRGTQADSSGNQEESLEVIFLRVLGNLEN